MTHTNDQERAEFEAVASDNGKWPKAIERDARGNYLLLTTANGWMWWQAARRAQVVPVADKGNAPRQNMELLGGDFYIVHTQAGFRKALKHFDGGERAPRDVKGFPKKYPAFVALSDGYQGYHFTRARCIPLTRLQSAMLAATPRPPEAAVKQSLTVEAECMTCSGHGAVGNIINAEPCPDCTPRGQFSEAAPVVPQFSKVAKQKLDYLLEAGEEITGYAIQNKDGRRGAIDCHGFVYWWQDAAPVQMPEPFGWIDDGGLVYWRLGNPPADDTNIYTEHQVRQILAAHGVKFKG